MSTEFSTASGRRIGTQYGRGQNRGARLGFIWDAHPDQLAADFQKGRVRVVVDEYGRKYTREEFARYMRQHRHEKGWEAYSKTAQEFPEIPAPELVNFRSWDDGADPPAS